jgi:H+/Cl- antiporter ClcA
MSGSEMPNWLRYSAAIIAAVLLGVVSEIPDFFLPTLQDPSWTPRIALVRAVAIGTAFGLIMATTTILFPRSPDDVHKRSFRRAVFAFLLFGGTEFAFECLGRPFFASGSETALAQLVQTGKGQLPLVLLAVFIVVILLRTRRAH